MQGRIRHLHASPAPHPFAAWSTPRINCLHARLQRRSRRVFRRDSRSWPAASASPPLNISISLKIIDLSHGLLTLANRSAPSAKPSASSALDLVYQAFFKHFLAPSTFILDTESCAPAAFEIFPAEKTKAFQPQRTMNNQERERTYYRTRQPQQPHPSTPGTPQ